MLLMPVSLQQVLRYSLFIPLWHSDKGFPVAIWLTAVCRKQHISGTNWHVNTTCALKLQCVRSSSWTFDLPSLWHSCSNIRFSLVLCIIGGTADYPFAVMSLYFCVDEWLLLYVYTNIWPSYADLV